jgi:hypothetical protein
LEPSPPSHPTRPTAPPDPLDAINRLLARPLADRVREHKYRFAQSVVFGLPVVALQLFGGRLGGVSSGTWVGLLQALLAGWVMYVGAAAMLFESVLLLRRGRPTADGLVAFLAIALYGAGFAAWLGIVLGAAPPVAERARALGLMAWAAVLTATWTGARWWWLSRRARAS